MSDIIAELDADLADAIAYIRANGYRVTKALPAKPSEQSEQRDKPQLNAIGKPYGENYDPNYRIRHKVTSIKRLYTPQSAIRFVQDDKGV